MEETLLFFLLLFIKKKILNYIASTFFEQMIKALNLANYIPQMAFFFLIIFYSNYFALYESHLDVSFENFHNIVSSLCFQNFPFV